MLEKKKIIIALFQKPLLNFQVTSKEQLDRVPAAKRKDTTDDKVEHKMVHTSTQAFK